MPPKTTAPADGTQGIGKRAPTSQPNPNPPKRSRRGIQISVSSDPTTNHTGGIQAPVDSDLITNQLGQDRQLLDQLANTVARLADGLDTLRAEVHTLGQRPVNQVLEAPHRSTSPCLSEPSTVGPTTGKDIPPNIKLLYPHLEASILLAVVSGTLAIKDLPKLIPFREHPKGRQNATSSGSSFHFETGQITYKSPQFSFEKDVPSIFHLLNILHVYAGIRTIYSEADDNLALAFNIYSRRLIVWHSIKNYSFPSIRDYVIQHFELYQASPDPKVWSTVDQDLFTSCIRHHIQPAAPSPTPKNTPTSRPHTPAAPTPRQPVCRVFNDQTRGCPMGDSCLRRHVCILCEREPVPHFQCKKHTLSKQ